MILKSSVTKYLHNVFADKWYAGLSRNWGVGLILLLIVLAYIALFFVFQIKALNPDREILILALSMLMATIIPVYVYKLDEKSKKNEEREALKSLITAFYVEIQETYIRYQHMKKGLAENLDRYTSIFIKLDPFIIYQNGTGLIDKINNPGLVALIIKIYNKGYDIIEGFKYLNHLSEEYKKASLRYQEHSYQNEYFNYQIPAGISQNQQETLARQVTDLMQQSFDLYKQKTSVLKQEADYYQLVYKNVLTQLEEVDRELKELLSELQGYFNNISGLAPIVQE